MPQTKSTGSAKQQKNSKQSESVKPDELFIITIGTSAGGLEALQEFLTHLPEIKNIVIIVAQHLSLTHKRMLVQLLSRETKLEVAQAEHGASLEANKVYITPPGKEISISAGKIILKLPQSSVGSEPGVDVLPNGKRLKITSEPDITEQKNSEELVNISHLKYKALIDNSLSAIFLTKPDGAIIEANPAAQLLFDYTLDELRNIGRQGIIDHSDATNIKEMLQKRDIHGRASGEIIGIRKNGDRFPIEFTSALFKDKNQEVFTYTILNDITEKKTAQQKLIDNEKRFRAMVENGSDAIVIFDATANLIYISPGVNRILGYTEQEALQLNSLNIIHPADGEYVRIKMQESLGKPGVPIKNICCRIKHKDGRWLYIEATITNLLHEPAIGGIVTNFSDVTQRKQIETQLSSITDNLKGVVFRYKQEVDGTNQMMYLSKGSINMWGIEAEMAMANNQLIWNLYHKDDLEAHIASIQQSKENLTEWTHEWRINHPDGSVRWQRGVGNPQRLPDGSVIWDSLIIDITAQKDLEKEKMDVANNLAERNVFIETILQNLPIGISVNKIDTGEATMINSNFSKIYGWEDKDLQNVAAFFEKVYPDETYRKEMIERVMNDIESRVPERMEWKGIEVTDRNGQKKTINAKNIPLYEQNLMISTVTDVSTEARQAAEIQKTKTDLDKIMKYSPDVVCTINEQGDFVKLSAATESIWGYTPEELIGKKYIELVHPDDREKTNLAAAAITSVRAMTNFENRYIRKDGSVVPIVWSAKWDDQEKMIFCIAKDGTEKNIAELAIIESEKKYKNLFENNPSPMFVWEFATKQIIDCNIEALMQYGYSREEFLQLSINEIRPKEDIAELEKVTANEKTYGDIHTRIWRHLRKNGELFFVEVNGHLIDYNGVKASLVMVTDITEKLTAEETIKESNQRYENVTKATYDAIWDWDMTSNKLYWGDMYTKLFGEISDKHLSDFEKVSARLHPDEIAMVLASAEAAIKGKELNWTYEHRYLKADGTYAFVSNKALIIRDKNERAIRVTGAMQDITKQKHEEQRLKLMSSVVTSTNDSVLITEAEPFDEPGPRIIYVNDAFTKMTGYTAEEVIGRTPRILQGPKSDKAELKRLSTALRKFEPCEITIINYKKNGDEFWINLSVSPVADEKGGFTHWICVERDVTERKNAELQKNLFNKITSVFNEPNNMMATLEKVLQDLTVFGGFCFAEAWLITADRKAINRISSYAETEAMKAFITESVDIKSFKMGEGLEGLTWESKTIQTWSDVDKKKKFIRYKTAKKAGLKTTVALPLFHNYEVVGVLTVGLDQDEKSLSGLQNLFDNLGNYIGAEIKRKQLEQELHQLFSFAPDVIAIVGMDGYFKKVNPATLQLLEYSESELLSNPYANFIHPDDKNKTTDEVINVMGGNPTLYFENRYITKSGKIKWLAWTATSYPQEAVMFAVAKDITEKKELEDLLQRATQMARIGGWEVDLLNNTVFWSTITKEIHEVAVDYVPELDTGINFYKAGHSQEKIIALLQKAMEDGQPWDEELQIVTAKGNERWVRAIGDVEIVNGKCIRIFGSFQDIDERKKSALAVTQTLEEKNNILESIGDAFYAVDKKWIVTYWNHMAEKVLGMSRQNIVGKNLWDIYKDALDPDFYKFYHLAVEENKVQHFEANYHNQNLWVEVSVYPSPNGLSVYFKDITERKTSEFKLKELNENLQKQARELEVSNRELEQFAFVASHDLQEPLRMVSSFLNQLNRKYDHLLDDKAKKYIGFAIEGAVRMRELILDLLEFSQVGRTDENIELVDLNDLIEEIKVLYRKQIGETQAAISMNKLPALHLCKTPLRQVFQNLISNALKYSKTEVSPVIKIRSADMKTYWLFSISDNGIGIDTEYFDKIFIIFQRLHNRDLYSGTGMGLAVTKKIIESLNGKIWVESAEGKGSTFYFTIPKN